MNWKDHLLVTTIVTIALIASISLTITVISPIQDKNLPELAPFASLFFLPHGIRVITAWLYGVWSIPYLLVATAIADFILRGSVNPNTIFITPIVCFAAFELFKLAGVDMYRMEGVKTTHLWRSLVLVAFVSSVFNSILHNIMLQSQILPENAFQTMLAYMVGDVTGTVAVLVILMLVAKALGLNKIQVRDN